MMGITPADIVDFIDTHVGFYIDWHTIYSQRFTTLALALRHSSPTHRKLSS